MHVAVSLLKLLNMEVPFEMRPEEKIQQDGQHGLTQQGLCRMQKKEGQST